MRDFIPDASPWSRLAPAKLQAAYSMPTPINLRLRGRIELTIGKLGAGKTTWSALRATRLARATGRTLATNGIGWPEQWQSCTSFDDLESLRDCVFVWDELHLMLPSSKGLLTAADERYLIKFLSLCRKRGIDVVGTTQAWTRCATHYRQLVTTVWRASASNHGVLHQAVPFEHPDDGGRQAFASQWFGPAAADIPTNAEVWSGMDLSTVLRQPAPTFDGLRNSAGDVTQWPGGRRREPASPAAPGVSISNMFGEDPPMMEPDQPHSESA